MKLEEIYEMWEKDAPIDVTDLQESSAKIPMLHSKYYKIYLQEKKLLHVLLKNYKQLKHEKTEFLINPTEEDVKEKGWKIPERGKIYRTELQTYLEGDSDLLDLELKINVQQEKTEFLKSIIQSFSSRGYLIKNIIEDRKFMQGG